MWSVLKFLSQSITLCPSKYDFNPSLITIESINLLPFLSTASLLFNGVCSWHNNASFAPIYLQKSCVSFPPISWSKYLAIVISLPSFVSCKFFLMSLNTSFLCFLNVYSIHVALLHWDKHVFNHTHNNHYFTFIRKFNVIPLSKFIIIFWYLHHMTW